jgi:hypothetical protein
MVHFCAGSDFCVISRPSRDVGRYVGGGGVSFCTYRHAHPAAVVKISHDLVWSPKLIPAAPCSELAVNLPSLISGMF